MQLWVIRRDCCAHVASRLHTCGKTTEPYNEICACHHIVPFASLTTLPRNSPSTTEISGPRPTSPTPPTTNQATSIQPSTRDTTSRSLKQIAHHSFPNTPFPCAHERSLPSLRAQDPRVALHFGFRTILLGSKQNWPLKGGAGRAASAIFPVRSDIFVNSVLTKVHTRAIPECVCRSAPRVLGRILKPCCEPIFHP